MATILKEFEISGKGLMKNRDCTVKVKPSNSGQIRFFVENAAEPIVADVNNVVSTNHCVVLGNRRHKVMLVEHFMAACAFMGIDSIDVYVSSPEMPIFDGSAKKWVELFSRVGIKKHKKAFYTVKEPVYYLNGKTHLIILPDKELNITYGVSYNHPDLKQRWVSFNKLNIEEIIEARTFGFLKDLKKYQLFGLAKGVNYENTVGLKDDGYTVELRSRLEPIKHKMLDLIADLYLTGVNPLNLRAQIIIKEAGHEVHIKTAKMLQPQLKKLKK